MESKNLNYQFSIFGDFIDIAPNNAETMIKLLTLYKEKNLIPSIFKEHVINFQTSEIMDRILLSNTEGWNINIASNRIDFTMFYNDVGMYNDMNIDTVTQEAMELIENMLTTFDKKAIRIAFNSTFLFNNEESNKIIEKYNTREKLISLYNGQDIKEWNERMLIQKANEQLNNEIINIGANMNKSEGEFVVNNKKNKFDGVVLQVDINTTPENIDARFDFEKIKIFFQMAIGYKKDIDLTMRGILNE